VALAQQNKARAAQSTEGDDALEQAFIDASSQSNVTAAATRRTREDLIKQLKQNMHSAHGREAEDESKVLEEATKASKFKPIGFKPIGVERGPGKKEKKAKEKDADGRKRKKRKMGEGGLDVVANPEDGDLEKSLPVTQPFTPRQLEPETDPDFDIFAGVGDYEGIGSDDDNDVVAGGHELDASVSADNMRTATADAAKGKWFDLEDQERARASSTPKETSIARPDTPTHTQPRDAEDLLAEQPTRLVPLASSAMPSVQDFLAMEQAAQALEKRRKRKEKKK
jgi:IK cytokine